MKKGQVWVSAILYLALGVIIIGIILGVALPLVNNMRDRNTYIQTKELMSILNKNVVDVINEGPGSKRYLSPINIEKGEIYIKSSEKSIEWRFKTKNKLMEPEITFNEGDLILLLSKTDVVGEYELKIKRDYSSAANIDLNSNLANPFVGSYSMTIENSGYANGGNKPTVTIYMKTL